ncbi:DUF2382 domain-containing protein [Rubrolithibacter danxiaensis]|uniref:DUF2382 domain-containing protein n=1 Tax=Rubrolithibacter danxiaensis TaxID=3390805 RepID=UPI003BF90834
MSHTVIGVFDYTNPAQEAVEYLENHGFSRENIDISVNRQDDENSESATDNDDNSFGDSISHFFSNLFGSDDDEEAKSYSEVGRRGSIVTVHTESREEAERAAEILDNYGAVDVNERAREYRSTSGMSDNTMSDRISDETTNRSIPIIEENLSVGKKVVETGGARIRSKIIERPVEESIRLRKEHVTVERNPVNRPASESDLSDFKEGTIEMREQAEVPVVGKESRIVEEVRLGKDVEETEETVRDTVRRTDVDIENLNASDSDRLRSHSDNSDKQFYSSDPENFNTSAEDRTAALDTGFNITNDRIVDNDDDLDDDDNLSRRGRV